MGLASILDDRKGHPKGIIKGEFVSWQKLLALTSVRPIPSRR
jgi:hypothetical protein